VVDRRQEVWGCYDPQTGQVQVHEREDPGDDDLLNTAVVYTLAHRGTVFAVEAGDMPERAPLVAIFRLPLGQRSSGGVFAEPAGAARR
jgi:hypothetical protein